MSSIVEVVVPTMGASFVGFLFAAILYGVTLSQAHIYFARNVRKSTQMQLLVVLIWLLSTFHVLCIAIALYHYLIQNFTKPFASLLVFWSLPTMVALSSVIEGIVRGVFIYRLWSLNRQRWILTVSLAAMNCVVVALSMVFAHESIQQRTFENVLKNSTWIVFVALLTDFFLDLSISASLALTLRTMRYAVPSKHQFKLINKFIVAMLRTGTITAMMSLTVLILFVQNRHSFAFMALYFPFAQVFFFSLLALLNLRESVPDAGSGTSDNPEKPGQLTVASFTHSNEVSDIGHGVVAHVDESYGADTTGRKGENAPMPNTHSVTVLSPNRGPPMSEYPPITPAKPPALRL